MITKELKYKMIGGGCRSSQIQTKNLQKIDFSKENVDLDDKFMIKFEKFTNINNMDKDIESENQAATQVSIIKCLKKHQSIIRRNIIIYKPKVIELIDVYLIYALTQSTQKEVFRQDEIQKIRTNLKKMYESFEIEARLNPACDLIFYFDILDRFNQTKIEIDDQNKNYFDQAVKFIKFIVKIGSSTLKQQEGNFMEGFDGALQGAQSLLKSFEQSKSNQIYSYLLNIWVRKHNKFSNRLFNLTYLDQIQFYITLFNELCGKNEDETDLVLLTLIKIDHYFSLAVEDQDNLKNLSQELSLNCNLIKAFIPLLIQKSDSKSFMDEMKSFLKFTVESHTYRFLTISILLKYNKIIEDTNDSNNYKQQIMEYLCYKYLCEKDIQVKLAFETSEEFVDHFNTKIESFKEKIIQLSYERNKVLKIFDLEKYEELIENIQDIDRMIAKTIIQKWERDVKRRQLEQIAQKDDVLLEVQDLYIEQSIKYIEGSKIIQSKQSLRQNNEKNKPYTNQNALLEILDNFLQTSIQTKENQNVNISDSPEQNKCQILGILAEGGTGKSMLIKKLETRLIQMANSGQEKEGYIPLLIKCNSLDPVKPSIEKFLLSQGINKEQINSLKKSDRNKVILLDGYDEFAGEYFRVYTQLNLNEWKNTKVIVTSRQEKLDLNDACDKFSKDGDNGRRDETSFCIAKLKKFTNENILEYYKMYFRQYRTKEEKFDELQYKNDLEAMEECMKNSSLKNLLYLPINLYLFTRMIVQVEDKIEIQKIKEKISDEIGIQDVFFSEQFKREAKDFVQACNESSKKNKDFEQLVINSFFEYFQSISMKMFINKGKIANFLQIRKDEIQFKLSNKIEKKLSKNQKNSLFDKITHYVNSKIITRSKEEIQINIPTHSQQNKSYLIEFKHKSLFEYFAARAMKYDFDDHGDNIHKLTLEQLQEFNINKKFIMNAGQNQSEQQILIKLYNMIKDEIESNDFYSNYYQKQIKKNSRYIQYIKKSKIKKNTETSQIDIGASNMLSALFLSKFSYSKLELNFCSISKLYVSSQKSDQINFDNCNLKNSYLKKLKINYDSCYTQFATFDGYQKVFSTSNIFSFNQVIWDKSNTLYSITESGFINAFKLVNDIIVLQKSKQLSQTSLNQILTVNNDTLLVSTQYSLLLINSDSFDLLQSYKFKNDICSMTIMQENILVTFKNRTTFYGSFQNGFRKLNYVGTGCVFNELKSILLVYYFEEFYLYNVKENIEYIKTIQGHSSLIRSVAFSVNGKFLATGSEDQTCKIWNVEKGFELINTIKDHTDSILSIAFSADEKYLTTGSEDQTFKIWSVEKDFELINTIQGHTDSILSVAFSEDGKYLATSSQDQTCKIWNAEKAFELINTYQGHTKQILSVAFSSDGKHLATGSEDKTCKIWNVQKGYALINTIQAHNDQIFSVAFSAEGNYLATGSRDNNCKIWNVEKGFELLKTIQGHTSWIRSVAFSGNGKYLATGSEDKTCKIWNIEQGFELINTIKGHTESILSVAFSADGKYLATGSSDKTTKIWKVEQGFEIINTIQGHTSDIFSVAFSADGQYLATGSSDSTCKIWNVEQGFKPCEIKKSENEFASINTISGHTKTSIYSIAFSVDGKYFATGSSDQTCNIWNVEKRFELINTIQGHTKYVYSVAFSADGKNLATGSSDKTCKIWNTEKGFELINSIQGHTDSILSTSFSADGKYFATSSDDYTFKIWNAEKGFELMHTIKGHSNSILSVAFSLNGKYLATGSKDKTCNIWNAEKGFELINSIQSHTDQILSVAFSANGKYLATGSMDDTCKIWNVEIGFELINTIQGHTSWVKSMAFSADGKYLATISFDKTCKILDVAKDFEPINTIQGDNKIFYSVAFSPDGKHLATGSNDSTCKIWNTEKEFELTKIIQGHSLTVLSIAFSVDGKYLATCSSDKTCKVWNVVQGFELINTIQGHINSILSVSFSPDGKYLATGSFDKTCKIWNSLKGFQLINTTQGHISNAVSVAFSEDESYLCILYNDKSYSIFDLQKQKKMREDMNYEKLKEKYQLEQNVSKFDEMRIFENIFIL